MRSVFPNAFQRFARCKYAVNAKGEEFLWNPALQVPKKTAPDTLVYDYDFRRRELADFLQTLNKYLPYCPVRYSF